MSLIPKIKKFLREELGLELHPHKMWLQHYSKGVKYLGCVLLPHRIYIVNRTKGNFYNAIEKYNDMVKDCPPCQRKQIIPHFISTLNSYLGLLGHYHTYHIREREVYYHLSSWWTNHTQAKNFCRKLVRR